jgi:hypothetical protein
MSKAKTLNVAKALTSQLHVTEEAIDSALAQAANLVETYITSRRAAHVSTVSGNEVHQSTLKAMMALSEAQRHMSDAHNHLSAIGEHMGIDVKANGAIDKPAAVTQTETV